MSVPILEPSQTVLQTELDKKAGQVLKIRYVYTFEGAYLAFTLSDNPARERILVTRRESTKPKLFMDQNVLWNELVKRYPGIQFEARGNPIPDIGPAAETPRAAKLQTE
jgi:hypothetical protein